MCISFLIISTTGESLLCGRSRSLGLALPIVSRGSSGDEDGFSFSPPSLIPPFIFRFPFSSSFRLSAYFPLLPSRLLLSSFTARLQLWTPFHLGPLTFPSTLFRLRYSTSFQLALSSFSSIHPKKTLAGNLLLCMFFSLNCHRSVLVWISGWVHFQSCPQRWRGNYSQCVYSRVKMASSGMNEYMLLVSIVFEWTLLLSTTIRGKIL